MSGINYYVRMRNLYNEILPNGADSMRKNYFLNEFAKDQGLKTETARKWFTRAVDVGSIVFVGRDDEGNELIRVE